MLKVDMRNDFLLPSPRFNSSPKNVDASDKSASSLVEDAMNCQMPDVAMLLDAVPVDPHMKFLAYGFKELYPREFYRELFPKGELDTAGEFNKGKYTAIAIRIFDDERKVYRYSVCDDLLALDELFHCNEFCVMSPVSYAGKSQRQANARKLYAIVFDLDGLLTTSKNVSKSLVNLFAHIELGNIPQPSHIVHSGTGLHLYYMLEQPLPLFPNVMQSLSNYRTCLVDAIWNPFITSLHEKHQRQYESVTQGFRMVGTKGKHGRTVRAFKIGEKVSIEYLNKFAPDDAKIDMVKYVSNTPMSVAKDKWPEWYEHRIVNGAPRGTWQVKRDLYDWWKRRIQERTGATVGHRYFCVMALAVYGRKCSISYEEVEKDALELIPYLNGLDETGEAPFTASDVVKALEVYDANYITFPRHTIEKITGISIPANKRNGRKQSQHVKMMNLIRDLDDPEGNWRYKPPTKEDEIKAYAAEHPEANHSQIARALGVSRTTVVKWLKQ